MSDSATWRYEIQYGPDGETDYAWVYDLGNNLVCTTKTHHAIAIVAAMRGHASDQSLSVLIKQYALDLRRNASGGDDYPYEYAKATADYLEELIKRAKGNCTCAQAGFPDSCDNCDGLSPSAKEKALRSALERALKQGEDRQCFTFDLLQEIDAALSDTSTDREHGRHIPQTSPAPGCDSGSLSDTSIDCEGNDHA